MIDTLAYQPDPYPAHATLRNRGVHRRADGRWVVARASDVAEVLGTPAAVVGFRPPEGEGALATIQAPMARFSDGPAHDRRRAITCEFLDALSPSALRAQARALTHERLDGMHDVDVMRRIARTVPVTVLAQALGITDLDTAVAATRQLCLALAPPRSRSPSPGVHDPDLPRTLRRLVVPVIGERCTDEQVANVVAVLFQAMDATAGLIGNAVVATHRRGNADIQALIATTNRDDPSVQLTTRVAASPVLAAGHTIPAGDRIVVVLAAANHDEGARTDFTFGAGLRPCPGRTHALALATGVVEALTTARARLADSEITYEHRSNLRIPARLGVRVG